MSNERILLDHGAGGRASRTLVETIILPRFRNPVLGRLEDSAVLDVAGSRLAFTTDSFVVDPIFFPGGDIGMLAVNGTVNDLAMSGARPLGLSAAFVLEEGFPMADFERIVESMAAAARAAEVSIVTGDTKVVPHGAADKIFITTAGVGLVPTGLGLSASGGRPGDRVIVSGRIGEHGVAILTQRAGLSLSTPCRTDSAPLASLVACMLVAFPRVHSLRDPTRGGLAATLNEFAEQAGVRIEIDESALPISTGVEAASELLGFDPLQLANEGVLVALVPEEGVAPVLSAMRGHPAGTGARVIGEVREGKAAVLMRTRVGGRRMIAMPSGVQLPRIC